MNAASSLGKLQVIRQVCGMLVSSGKFDNCMNKLNIVSVENGRLEAEMIVEEAHTNVGGTLHGGMVASLVDYTSSLALVTDDLQQTGYSVDMNITYINPAKVGEHLFLEAQTVKRGKSLAYLDVTIFNKDTRKIIALGKQVKYTGHNHD